MAGVPTAPTPYELYIRLSELAATWPDGGGGWAGEVAATCGFQAAELTLRLIDDALGDERAAAFARGRVARYTEHLIAGVELTCRLLRELPPPNSRPAIFTQPLTPASPGLAVRRCLDSEQLETISSRLTLACAGLRYQIGIEQQLEDARRAHGLVDLVPQNQGRDAAAMDYRAVVSPDVVYALREHVPCGPEDHLFSTVHQISECWLRIAHHYLAEAHALALSGSFADAAAALINACDVLPLAVQVGQLLDQMVLVDYHPLRVRLRDGSGAQSSAARGLGPALQKAAAVLWEALESTQVSVLDILQRPNEHLEQYQYLNALKCAGKRVQRGPTWANADCASSSTVCSGRFARCTALARCRTSRAIWPASIGISTRSRTTECPARWTAARSSCSMTRAGSSRRSPIGSPPRSRDSGMPTRANGKLASAR